MTKLSDSQRGTMVSFARSMCGKARWRHRGRKPWAVDCIGLVVLALSEAGFAGVKDRLDYGREPWRDGLKEELSAHFGAPVDDMQAGDIALIRWENMGGPSHVAIIGDYCHGGLSIIHAHSAWGVTEHRIDDKWHSMIVEAYRP